MKIAHLLRDGALFGPTASLPAATAAVASAGLRPLSRMITAGVARLLLFAMVVAVVFSPAFVPMAQAAPGDLDALNLFVSELPHSPLS